MAVAPASDFPVSPPVSGRTGSFSTTGSAGATFLPLYQQIKSLITQALETGEWKPGTSIPSENELALRFGVSQGTVRKAIDELAAENLLVRRQGKGTFVASHHEPRAAFRFLRVEAESGAPLQTTSQYLECRRIRAPAEIARQLELRTADNVVFIRRVLSNQAVPDQVVPFVLEEIWLPGVLFKGLTFERLSNYSGPMYGLFETEFDIRMIRATERLKAVAAPAEAVELLHVKSGAPLLQVERLSFTYQDRPVEVRLGLYLTDEHYYRNDLS
jgi:GntR family transcriptional regulator